jgi:crotonobetaine/carnitine-CoA ligase
VPSWSAGEQESITGMLLHAATTWPARYWLDFEGETFTFADIDRLSTRLGNALIDLGAKVGEPIAVMLDNSADAIVAIFAITRIGAIIVPINTANRGEFLRHQLADCGAGMVIAEADFVERITSIAGGLTQARLILYRGFSATIERCPIQCRALDAHRGTDDTPIAHSVDPGDVAYVLYTSGTTGPAKGCMISHNHLTNMARRNVEIYSITSSDIMWTCLPLFHVYAVASAMFPSICVGGRFALAPKFSVSTFWPEIVRTGATLPAVLGSIAVLIAQAPENEWSRRAYGQMRNVLGAPWPGDSAEIWRRRFGVKPQIASRVFGMTEAAFLTYVSADVIVPPGSCGRANTDYEVRIVDDQDRELPPGIAGEVICRPLKPNVMFSGYWRRPADTLTVMRNLWFHTGDIGKFDEDGFFYFVDRKKDYLRRRGENISTFEMEATLNSHPAVAEVAVHAVASEIAEDEIKVTVVLHRGAALTERELCLWCLDKVPYFAVPRFIEFRSGLPRNPVGRVLKHQLRAEGCTPLTWDREKAGVVVERR